MAGVHLWSPMSTAKLLGNVWHASHWNVHPPFGLKVVLNFDSWVQVPGNMSAASLFWTDSSQPLGLRATSQLRFWRGRTLGRYGYEFPWSGWHTWFSTRKWMKYKLQTQENHYTASKPVSSILEYHKNSTKHFRSWVSPFLLEIASVSELHMVQNIGYILC